MSVCKFPPKVISAMPVGLPPHFYYFIIMPYRVMRGVAVIMTNFSTGDFVRNDRCGSTYGKDGH